VLSHDQRFSAVWRAANSATMFGMPNDKSTYLWIDSQPDSPAALARAAAGPAARDDYLIGSEMLARISDVSASVHLVWARAVSANGVVVQYVKVGSDSACEALGSTSAAWDTAQTVPASAALQPAGLTGFKTVFTLGGLAADTTYAYRVAFTHGTTRSSYCLHTAPADWMPASAPSTVFTVQADTHMDENSDGEVYKQTLLNALADRPRFHIDIGDTFMGNKMSRVISSLGSLEPRYIQERAHLDLIAHSVPIYLTNGNHKGEVGAGAATDSVAFWTTTLRKQYFSSPSPGTTTDRDSYFAVKWEMDILCVVLDVYWWSLKNPTQGDVGWKYSLGKEQYEWLYATLASSAQKHKLVFIHTLVGGVHSGNGRGGMEQADFYEWGGHNADGSYGFPQQRPDFRYGPIVQILKQFQVSAVFHGHDHLFVKQDYEGIVYCTLPQPSYPSFVSTSASIPGNYTHGIILPSAGYLRFTSNQGDAKLLVEYVRSVSKSTQSAPANKPGFVNGDVAYTFLLPSDCPNSAKSTVPCSQDVLGGKEAARVTDNDVWFDDSGAGNSQAGSGGGKPAGNQPNGLPGGSAGGTGSSASKSPSIIAGGAPVNCEGCGCQPVASTAPTKKVKLKDGATSPAPQSVQPAALATFAPSNLGYSSTSEKKAKVSRADRLYWCPCLSAVCAAAVLLAIPSRGRHDADHV
jgi:hypothetical protein